MSEFGEELRSVVAKLMSEPDEQVPGALPAVWDQIVELGLVGVGIPEDRGGQGGALDDLVVVTAELARHGVGTPFVEAATTAWVLGDSSPAFDTLVLAPTESFTAQGTVSGTFIAPWGMDAARLVVVGDSSVGWVDLAAVGKGPVVDIAGRQGARVTLERTAVTLIDAARDEVLARLAVLRAASLLGAGRGACDLTRAYVREREQFGAPLLKLPAVAANLARMSTELTQAEAALDRAVVVLSDDGADPLARRDAAAVARVTASAMATVVARQSHQLHGAMGVAAEYPLHHLTRALWAGRDADEPELALAVGLGSRALAVSENELWDSITA